MEEKSLSISFELPCLVIGPSFDYILVYKYSNVVTKHPTEDRPFTLPYNVSVYSIAGVGKLILSAIYIKKMERHKINIQDFFYCLYENTISYLDVEAR